MRRLHRFGFVAALFLLAAALALPLPSFGGITGSLHDITLLTDDEEGDVCANCHIPHRAQGERLWKQTPSGPQSGWGSRTVAQLCYMCHNATGGGCGAHDVTATAYSDQSHGYRIDRFPMTPDGLPEVIEKGAFLPYIQTLMDCSTCHNPHDNTYPPFLREATIDRLCRTCHHRDWPGGVGTFNLASDGRSYHPADTGYSDLDGNLETRLEPFPEGLQVETRSGEWALGPHRQGWRRNEGGIGCQTCHPIHGWNEAGSGLGVPPLDGLVRYSAVGDASSPLCESCHQGGQGIETVGNGADHPINVHSPETDPFFASGGIAYPPGWPSGAAKEPLCSSCHDVHGGVGGTSLLRTDGDPTWWCLSCHQASTIVPPWHHSSIYNDDDPSFTSVLTCQDCHGRSGSWSAHNGFTDFVITVSTTDSALCELCHRPENPLEFLSESYRSATGRNVAFGAAVFPALHGRVSGTDSHMVDAPDDDSTFNTRIFRGVWAGTGGVSEYGPAEEMLCESCHGILVNAGPLTAERDPLHGGWQANLLLEPYEDNSPGVAGVEVPDNLPGKTGDALCRACHTDDKTGYVHYPGPHTIAGYIYSPGQTPQGRMTVTLMTTPNDPAAGGCPEVSSADRTTTTLGGFAGAPGAFSFPKANELDCDSCHRPHGADDRAFRAGYGHVIVEFSEGQPKSDSCQECHDTQKGCR